jgi:hypothetical protein
MFSGLTDVVWGHRKQSRFAKHTYRQKKRKEKKREKRSKRIQLKLFEVKHCCVG